MLIFFQCKNLFAFAVTTMFTVQGQAAPEIVGACEAHNLQGATRGYGGCKCWKYLSASG